MKRLRDPDFWRAAGAEALAAAAGPAALLLGLRRAVATFGEGLWGPADPWLNVDFNGGWWLWWASAEEAAGRDPWSRVGWPGGVESIAGVFPNPLELLALGRLLGAPTVMAWNMAQLVGLLLNLLAAHALMRAAGASRLASAAGGALLGVSPVLLFEVAGGRPVTQVVWPGLLSLALLAWACREKGGREKGGRALVLGAGAGVMAAAQGVSYAWYGAALFAAGVVVALPSLRRSWRAIGAAVVAGAVVVTPYLLWLSAGLEGVPTDKPEAGYASLPLAGLWGMAEVPERFRLHPLLFGASLLGLRGGGRWLLAGWVGLAIAVGPGVTWALGEPIVAGPWAWVCWAVEAANRNHHPIRTATLALPLLATALALGLDRMRWRRILAAGLMLSAGWGLGAMDRVTTYDQSPEVPFGEVVLPAGAVAADVLGMKGQTVLSLQTVHGAAVTEPLWMTRPPVGLHAGLDRLSRGEGVSESFWEALGERGVTHVLVLDRYGDASPRVQAAVRAGLGEPVSPGVYAVGSGSR